MIHLRNVKRFCKEFEKIENYQEAVNSPEKWDCHHRLEETGLSRKDLIDKRMYYNRPASELIFITHKVHISLHQKGKINSDKTKKKMSTTRIEKHLSAGKNNPRYKHICSALLQMMYIEQGKPSYKIAQELGISTNTVIGHLRELNIPIRKR